MEKIRLVKEESLRLATRYLERYPRRFQERDDGRVSPRRPETVDEKTETVDAQRGVCDTVCGIHGVRVLENDRERG